MSRLVRISTTFFSISTIVLLSACGGGGGGSNEVESPKQVSISHRENSDLVQSDALQDAIEIGVDYEIRGMDGNKLKWNSGTLSFLTTPDYEMPLDANGDNVYEISLEPLGSESVSRQIKLSITVDDVVLPSLEIDFPIDGSRSIGEIEQTQVSGDLVDLESGARVPHEIFSTLTINGSPVDSFNSVNGRWTHRLPLELGENAIAVDLSADSDWSVNSEINFTNAPAHMLDNFVVDELTGDVFFYNRLLRRMGKVNRESGEIDLLPLSDNEERGDLSPSWPIGVTLSQRELIFVVQQPSGDDFFVWAADITTNEMRLVGNYGSFKATRIGLVGQRKHEVDIVNNTAWFMQGDGALLAVNLEDGEASVLPIAKNLDYPEGQSDLYPINFASLIFDHHGGRAFVVEFGPSGDRMLTIDLADGSATLSTCQIVGADLLGLSRDRDILFIDSSDNRALDPDTCEERRGPTVSFTRGDDYIYRTSDTITLRDFDFNGLVEHKLSTNGITTLFKNFYHGTPIPTGFPILKSYNEESKTLTIRSSGAQTDSFAYQYQIGVNKPISQLNSVSDERLALQFPFDIASVSENTLLVGDSRFNDEEFALLSYDLSLDKFSLLSSPKWTQGSGPRIDGVWQLDYDESENKALVWQRAPDTTQRSGIFSIDLANGNRALISGASKGTGPELTDYSSDLIYDFPKQRAYLLDYDQNALLTLLEIDLNTGNRVPVSGDLIGAGPSIELHHRIDFQKDSDTIVLHDLRGSSLLVDLQTGDRAPSPQIFNQQIYDIDNQRAFSSGPEVITALDLTSGQQIILSKGNERNFD